MAATNDFWRAFTALIAVLTYRTHQFSELFLTTTPDRKGASILLSKILRGPQHETANGQAFFVFMSSEIELCLAICLTSHARVGWN